MDALGNTTTYEAYLSSQFPGISFTVTTKADSKFKIVGAASVAAKVTRDACVDGWTYEELLDEDNGTTSAGKDWNREFGSGYPSGLLYTSRRNSPPTERSCRSKDSNLDKDLSRSHFRFPNHSPLFVDDCESHIGEICAFCKMVTGPLYHIQQYPTHRPFLQDRRGAGIIKEGVRWWKGEGQRPLHCRQGPWNSEHWNAIKSLRVVGYGANELQILMRLLPRFPASV